MRNLLRTIAATGLLLFGLSVHAADPTTRILVGFPPGGSTDGVARFYAEGLGKALNRVVIVENRPGAGGAIAAAALKAAPADGGTLMLAAIANISLYPSVANLPTYDPFKDFAAVAMVGKYDLALAVNAATGVDTLAAYIAWIKASPSNATFGSPGLGTLPHLFGSQLAKVVSVDMVHVPFQGAAPSLTSLLGGQVGAIIQPVSDLVAQHQAGKIRVLANTGAQRNKQLPNVPTFKELGFADLEGGGWIGFFAPAGVPPQTANAIWEAVQSIQAAPAVQARMQTLGFDVSAMTAAEFAALTRRDALKWARVINASDALKK